MYNCRIYKVCFDITAFREVRILDAINILFQHSMSLKGMEHVRESIKLMN